MKGDRVQTLYPNEEGMAVHNHIPGNTDLPRRYRRIEAYIHNNLSGDLRAAVVAKRLGMSVSSLLHIFREHGGQTYQQYVADARMQTAYQILAQGGRVKEAMYATGYKVKSTFNRAFKRAFGHPPGYFRQ